MSTQDRRPGTLQKWPTTRTWPQYLHDVHGLRRVERAEEPSLLAASRNGDDAATKRLIEGPRTDCASCPPTGPPWASSLDAIQEANLVLDRLIADPSVSRPVTQLTPAFIEHYEGDRTAEGELALSQDRSTHQDGGAVGGPGWSSCFSVTRRVRPRSPGRSR